MTPARTHRPVYRDSVWALRLLGLILAGMLAATLWASTDWDRMRQLALQRYGQGAADVVVNWRRLVTEGASATDRERLERVNTFFNRQVIFESDQVAWGQPDYWATPLEFIGKRMGDCEDYAIAKYMTLRMMGVGNEQLRLIYVRARTGSTATEAHMVLGYYPKPTEEPLILDNLIGSVRPASQRSDLSPVFSFNAEGLWVGGAVASSADPTARLSRWRDVLERMRADGL